LEHQNLLTDQEIKATGSRLESSLIHVEGNINEEKKRLDRESARLACEADAATIAAAERGLAIRELEKQLANLKADDAIARAAAEDAMLERMEACHGPDSDLVKRGCSLNPSVNWRWRWPGVR